MAKFEKAIIIDWVGKNVSKLLLSQDIFELDIT
jgi:hypothetical protein